jgi:hypothetical protein
MQQKPTGCATRNLKFKMMMMMIFVKKKKIQNLKLLWPVSGDMIVMAGLRRHDVNLTVH